MARVLVAMSGGVDSSVAAAILVREGHQVVGVTLKLWGGASDSGCCSVADVEDARFVANQLGIKHLVFNLSDEFDSAVVGPYVDGYLSGETPNPCIECNRHIKFGSLISRARSLGFDYLATGHYARIGSLEGVPVIRRAVDQRKDQSYVLSVIPPSALPSLLLPVGEIEKSEVRRLAMDLGLRTAQKPDSLEVCFISKKEGKEAFLSRRAKLDGARVKDLVSGREYLDPVPFESVTVGQRRRVGGLGDGMRRYVIDKDPGTRTITVGTMDRLLVEELVVGQVMAYCGGWPKQGMIQGSAHGSPVQGWMTETAVRFSEPARRIAPGQTVALYNGDLVVASGQVVRG